MKTSAVLFATFTALLAVSATAWPFYPPHPFFPFPPHPYFPFPPVAGGSAPAPSSSGAPKIPSLPSLPPVADMTKCMQATHDSNSAACSPFSYNAGNCCTHLSGLGDSCSYIPYYKSALFQGLVKHVCDGGSGSSPSPPSS